MLVPLSWLKDYVDINVSPDVLEEKLFSCGFEVEEKYEVGKDISNVVCGLVKECEAIPDTHLHICQVDCGDKGSFQICCGADNVVAGKKFPVALVGASVLMTAKDHKTVEGVMTIKKGKLRGLPSNGMLCSAEELKMDLTKLTDEEKDGIYILPAVLESEAGVWYSFPISDTISAIITAILGIALLRKLGRLKDGDDPAVLGSQI